MSNSQLPYTTQGTIVHGAGRGRTLGFPTANLDIKLPDQYQLGIYAAWVIIESTTKKLPAAVYWGTQPTFSGQSTILEIYILDESVDLYDSSITVTLTTFIRPDRQFHDPDTLIRQMNADVAAVRQALFTKPIK